MKLRPRVSYKQNYWIDIYRANPGVWEQQQEARREDGPERIYNLNDWLIKQKKLSPWGRHE